MLTFKLKPKTAFGIILLLTGVVVIAVSFIGNHPATPASKQTTVSCKTAEERVNYINSLGFETDSSEESKEIIIPTRFNDVYNKYNEIQKKQGLDLSKYRSKRVKRWTYIIKNYPGYSETDDCVRINLLVFDGCVIGGDVSWVELDGFMHTFAKEDAS